MPPKQRLTPGPPADTPGRVAPPSARRKLALIAVAFTAVVSTAACELTSSAARTDGPSTTSPTTTGPTTTGPTTTGPTDDIPVVKAGSEPPPTNESTVPPSDAPPSSGPTATADPSVALFDFTSGSGDASSGAGWFNRDDPVMGGLSQSTATGGNGLLVFAGTVSLENNGGFASIVSAEDPELGSRAANGQTLRIRAAGDGKTYVVQLRLAGKQYRYIQRLPTDTGGMRVYELPLSGFAPVTFMLTPAPDAPATVDPSQLSEIALYVTDKQSGPFELKIERIDVLP